VKRARLQVPFSRKERRPKPDEVLYRRSPFLISYWRDNQLVFENFLTRRRVSASPLTSTILHFFDRDRSLRALYAAFTGYTAGSLRIAAQTLAKHSLLQRQGRKPPPGESELRAWSEWNPAAGFFHLSTKDLSFEPDAAKEFRELIRLVKSKPIPKPVKHYPKTQHVPLPAPAFHSEFSRALTERRMRLVEFPPDSLR